MLKRISTKNLILGMYLHEFCGSWMEHPFWRAKFVLKDPKDLERIQATAIDEVWIDTSKGLDVAAGVSSVSREEADLQIDSEFAQLEDMPAIVIEEPPRPALPRRGREPTSMAFFKGAGTERLYSGVTNSTASLRRISSRKRFQVSGGASASISSLYSGKSPISTILRARLDGASSESARATLRL